MYWGGRGIADPLQTHNVSTHTASVAMPRNHHDTAAFFWELSLSDDCCNNVLVITSRPELSLTDDSCNHALSQDTIRTMCEEVFAVHRVHGKVARSCIAAKGKVEGLLDMVGSTDD